MFPGNYFGHRFYARSYFVDVVLDPVPGPPPWATGGFGGGAGGSAPRSAPEKEQDVDTFLMSIMAEKQVQVPPEGPVFVVRPVFLKVPNEDAIIIEMETPISPPHK